MREGRPVKPATAGPVPRKRGQPFDQPLTGSAQMRAEACLTVGNKPQAGQEVKENRDA